MFYIGTKNTSYLKQTGVEYIFSGEFFSQCEEAVPVAFLVSEVAPVEGIAVPVPDGAVAVD